LFFSISIHIVGLWVFYLQPIFLRPILTTFFGKSPEGVVIPISEEDVALSEKNIALEEIFNQIVVLAPGLRPPYDLPVVTKSESTSPIAEETKAIISTNITSELPEIKLTDTPQRTAASAFEAPVLAMPPVLSVETQTSPIIPISANDTPQTQEYIRDLDRIAALPHAEGASLELPPLLEIHYPPLAEDGEMKPLPKTQGNATPPISSASSEMIALLPPEALSHHHPAFSLSPTESPYLGIAHLQGTPPAAPASTLPALATYALPKSYAPLEWADDFDVEVLAVKQEEGKHLFSLSLTPKFDLAKRKMRQNYYFLIDRSNSIDRHRYRTFKRAVARCLQSLQEGDRFNIIVFDTKIVKMNERPVAYTQKSRQLAEDFLEKQPHGTYFSTTDIYHALPKIMPTDLAEDEAHSAILISDGETTTSAEKQHLLLRNWLAQNDGRVALYTTAVGKNNNLALLDLLSTFSHGRLLYSDTHTSFPRKLSKLILDLRNPIATEMEVSIMKANPDSHLELFSYTPSLPVLFSKRPFTIYGMTDTLSDFTILIQGRNKSEPLSIKKNISFSNAKPGGRALALQWRTLEARRHFTAYIQEGRPSDLKQALLSNDYQNPRR